jgi:hypothetical protein
MLSECTKDAVIAEVVRCRMFSKPSFGLFCNLYTWLFWICRGLWNSLISYCYFSFATLQNWIRDIQLISYLPRSFSLPTLMDISPYGLVKLPLTKTKTLKAFFPMRDCVSLTMVLMHICIQGVALIQLLILLLLIHLSFWICRGLWNSLISYCYFSFATLQNWIRDISYYFA